MQHIHIHISFTSSFSHLEIGTKLFTRKILTKSTASFLSRHLIADSNVVSQDYESRPRRVEYETICAITF